MAPYLSSQLISLILETSKRNRTATSHRIVDAFDELLAETGLDGLTVNVLAEKAQVSRVLIYRYFGGLEGVVEYYLRQGRLVPTHPPAWLDQLQPTRPQELAHIWSEQSLQVFRQHRASRSAREIIKATVQENAALGPIINKTLDEEMSRLVGQFSFVEGANHRAISALILGGLSYLTIQADLDHSVIGLDLRNESDWQQVEDAVRTLYKALNQLAVDSSGTQFNLKEEPEGINW